MKKSILALALTLAFSLAAFAQSSYGGSSSQSRSSAQPPSSTAQSNSSMDKSQTSTGKEKGITGCLEQGTSPGSYIIKNAKHPEGVQVSYNGSEDLSKHIGHKVHASGTLSGDTLNATNVKHISETCTVGGGGEAATGHHHGSSNTGAGTETGTSTNPSSGSQNPK